MLAVTSRNICTLTIPMLADGTDTRIILDENQYYPVHPEATPLLAVNFNEDGWQYSTPQEEEMLVAFRDKYPTVFEGIQDIFESALAGSMENDEDLIAQLLENAGFEIVEDASSTYNLEPYTWVFSALGNIRLPRLLDGKLSNTVDLMAGDYIVNIRHREVITGKESRIERLNNMPYVELWRYAVNGSRFLIESTYMSHNGGGDLTLESLLPVIGDEYYNSNYYYGSEQPPEINLVNFNSFLRMDEGEVRQVYNHTGIPLYLDEEGKFKLPELIQTEEGLAYVIQPEGLMGTVESTRIEGAVASPMVQLDEELVHGKTEEEIHLMNQEIMDLIQGHSEELMGLVILP